jgi:fucose permease
MLTLLLLIIIYLSFISLGLPDSLLGSAWPSMYTSLKVPLYYAGFISIIIASGTVVSSIFSERIIRRFGTGTVTAVSVLMTAAALMGFSFFHVFIVLCLLAVPLGLGAGSVDSALNNYVALHYKARHMSWLHCFWGIGASIGPIIMSASLKNNNSWHLGYRTIGIIQFCLVLILFLSLPLWENKNRKTQEEAVQGQPIKRSKLFHIPGIKQVLIAFFCYCAIESITGLWGSSYLVMVKNISPKIAAQWIALYYIGITTGRFISGFITMQLTSRQMIRLGQGIIACGVVVLLLPLGNKALLPGFFLIGLGCAPIFPSLLHETPENFGKVHSQAIMGIQMASAYMGATLMPPLFGRIASNIGFTIFPLSMGVLLILKIVMTELLHKKVQAIKQE